MPGKFTIALQAILLPPFCGGVGSLPVACLSKIAGCMYLLYLDESGSEDSDHFVVGGLAVHENDAAAIAGRVDDVFRTLPDAVGSEEFHAQHVRTGRGPWRRVPPEERRRVTAEMSRILLAALPYGRRAHLFAVVIHRKSFPRLDPYERAYEEFFARGNAFVGRLTFNGEAHRCLAIADKSRLEARLQKLMQGWRTQGGSTVAQIRPMVGYAEVPLFVESGASRLIQLADFVAHWVFRAYESQDPEILHQLGPAFDNDGRELYGLVHLVQNFRACQCLACRSRSG